jgi:hypothetical protein
MLILKHLILFKLPSFLMIINNFFLFSSYKKIFEQHSCSYFHKLFLFIFFDWYIFILFNSSNLFAYPLIDCFFSDLKIVYKFNDFIILYRNFSNFFISFFFDLSYLEINRLTFSFNRMCFSFQMMIFLNLCRNNHKCIKIKMNFVQRKSHDISQL